MRFLRNTMNSSKDNNKQYESSKQHLKLFLPEYIKLKKYIYFINIFYMKLYEEVEIHHKFSNSNYYIILKNL